jgi:hypothetical protein
MLMLFVNTVHIYLEPLFTRKIPASHCSISFFAFLWLWKHHMTTFQSVFFRVWLFKNTTEFERRINYFMFHLPSPLFYLLHALPPSFPTFIYVTRKQWIQLHFYPSDGTVSNMVLLPMYVLDNYMTTDITRRKYTSVLLGVSFFSQPISYVWLLNDERGHSGGNIQIEISADKCRKGNH